MFKLLTEEERYKVAHEYVIRRAIVILCALILVAAVGIAGLLPSYVLSNARQNEALERTRIMNSSGEKGDKLELQTWLKETNHKLQVLSPVLDTDRPSDFIDRILDQRITGVSITSFSWARAKDKITLSVNGVALDRQSLIVFENRIRSSGSFSEVTLPISNLAKDRNIDFQIKFSPL
ncbi:MAG: hypothetical protein Q7R89_02520 [bacterium]|nr:hypothetical protein [bacterium]